MSPSDRPNRHSVNKIFGDSLPEIGSDERDDDPSESGPERDRWLQENVPPHHG